jgi:hypothetical protein
MRAGCQGVGLGLLQVVVIEDRKAVCGWAAGSGVWRLHPTRYMMVAGVCCFAGREMEVDGVVVRRRRGAAVGSEFQKVSRGFWRGSSRWLVYEKKRRKTMKRRKLITRRPWNSQTGNNPPFLLI